MNDVIYDLLNAILPGEVYLQGTLASEEYPDTFVTFWNDGSSDAVDLDNDTALFEDTYTVIVYSKNPARASALLTEIRSALKNAGYIVSGTGYDYPTDRPPHVAKTLDFTILKK